MAKKSDVTKEEARGLIDRMAQELGLLVEDKSGFIKVAGPTNKHRIYVQKTKHLGRIDFTYPLATDDPMYQGLESPIGAIACHIQPTLENLERALRMLGDGALEVQVSNKPRPFEATRAPNSGKVPNRRMPNAVVAPVDMTETQEFTLDGETLGERLAHIRHRAQEGRINKLLENGQAHTREEAIALLSRNVSERDLAEASRAAEQAEAAEVIRETGIEVDQ